MALLFELLCGLPLLAVAFLGVRTLLQSLTLVYLLFPLLCVAGAAMGFWRGRASRLAAWQIATLLSLPLCLVVLYFLSARAPLLPALPILATASVALGLAAARADAPRERRPLGGASRGVRRLAMLLLLVLAVNLPLAFLVPRFVTSFVDAAEVTEPAPPFQLTLLEGGGTVSARQLRGQVVVLDFWATWCIPCRRELPELERLRKRFQGRPGVAFYAVDFAQGDSPGEVGDSPEQARRFLRGAGYRLTAAYDAGGTAAHALSLSRLPALVLIDPAGRIRLRHLGFIGAEDLVGKLTGLIDRLLAANAGG